MIDPTELTVEQQKAWNSLKRAVAKCEKANVFFYQVLEYVHPLNGDVTFEVDDHCGKPLPDDAFNLDGEILEHVKITCGFADDSHHVILK
tara:strand:+ start:235 stop:504 length:270 start_codon:yes stop_codon:yes gene_type:complete